MSKHTCGLAAFLRPGIVGGLISSVALPIHSLLTSPVYVRRFIPSSPSPSDDQQPAPTEREMTGRREMYNRRYQSLQRSFRSAHQQRRDPNRTFSQNLTPVESVGAISYIPVNSGTNRQGSSEGEGATEASTLPHRGTKNKSKGWFTFGRRGKHQRITQQTSSSSSTEADEALHISLTSPDPLFSPLTPPPSMDDFESTPSSHTRSPEQPTSEDRERRMDVPDDGDMMVGRLELEHERGDGRRAEGEGVERAETAALIAAINASDPTQQQRESQERSSLTTSSQEGVVSVRPQRIRVGSRTSRQTRERSGTDTDEETDVLSQRNSMASPEEREREREEREREREEKEREREKPASQESSTKSKHGKKRGLSKGLKSSPALKFITRQDLYSFLNTAGVSRGEG